MTARERVVAALTCRQPDRVPLLALGIDPLDPGWRGRDASYRPLIDLLLEEQVEIKHRWGVDTGAFYSAAPMHITSRVIEQGGRTRTETTLHTPKGPLTAVSQAVPATTVTATIKNYVQSEEDLDRLLSLPYQPPRPDVSSFAEADREVGDRGVVTCRIADPMGIVGGACQAEALVLLCATQTDVIVRALDVYMERIYGFLEHVLRGGAKPIFIIIGPEYVTPPLLSPRFFRPLVTGYLSRLVELIHAHGALAIIHCHGNVDAVLEALIETGADGLHPVEAPPMGDVTLAEAKRRMEGRMAIVGNMQIGDLYDRTPDEINRQVRDAIRDAGRGGGLVLATTATPYQLPLSPRTLENYRALIEACQTYGAY
jgi:hypothetical protein